MCKEVEQYFSTTFKQQWHEVWREGRTAQENGIQRFKNPYKLKVWRAVWEYGWDNRYL